MHVSEAWRQPVILSWVTVDGQPYIKMQKDFEQKNFIYKGLFAVSSKFATSIRNARGFKASTKLSDLRMLVYKLLICNTTISIIPIELEQETTSVTAQGEDAKSWTMYMYLLNMIQKFLVEAVNAYNKKE